MATDQKTDLPGLSGRAAPAAGAKAEPGPKAPPLPKAPPGAKEGVKQAQSGAGKPTGKPAAAAAPRERKPGRLALFVAVLALLVAAAALGGSGWLYLQERALQQELSQLRANVQMRWDGLADHTALKAIDERTRTLAERAAQRFSGLDNDIGALEQMLRANAEDEIRDERGWRLAEVEYVLRIATHRLALLRDLDGAIAALQTADGLLRDLGSPVFLGLREQIEGDIRRLRNVARPDLPGTAIRLAGLIEQIGGLPPAGAGTGASEAPTATPAAGFWGTLQRLVVVKRNDQRVTAPPLDYAPKNHALTLAASLGTAQNAALAADETGYREALAAAATTLREHFDQSAQSTAIFSTELQRLAATPLRMELPDISASFALLEELRAVDRQAAKETAQ